MERRAFCVHAAQAASLLGVAQVLQACGGSSPTSPSGNAPSLSTISGTVAGGVVSVTIDAASPLASVGGAALVQTSLGGFLVSRTAQSTFAVLTATCTHEACTITGFRSSTYVCPCHGSQYSTSGTVLTGPAPRSLRQYASDLTNDTLTWAA